MTNESRIHRRALVAGIAMIVIVNAVALGNAAYNRSGEPDALLSLTERELDLPYDWGRDRDNSGLALRMQWRVVGAEQEDTLFFGQPYMSYSRTPAWLDSAKLESLGVRMTRLTNTPEGRSHYRRQMPKPVLLVMEMDGPAYALVRARVREWAAREESLRTINPAAPQFASRALSARGTLEREERAGSRLFVVDAGLDRAALRALYPDRARYAIVRGAVRPQVVGPDTALRLDGYVTELPADRINVPRSFRTVFDSVRRIATPPDEPVSSPFSVSVAFGRRLEPWITAADRRP